MSARDEERPRAPAMDASGLAPLPNAAHLLAKSNSFSGIPTIDRQPPNGTAARQLSCLARSSLALAQREKEDLVLSGLKARDKEEQQPQQQQQQQQQRASSFDTGIPTHHLAQERAPHAKSRHAKSNSFSGSPLADRRPLENGLTSGSPTRGVCRRLVGASSLKRKRPPMLDIPMKDAFTASPSSTPEKEEEAPPVEDLRELCEEGRGFAVLCKRGRRREVMEDRYQAEPCLGGATGVSFFGVFDGHGGTAAAEFTAKQLHQSLLDSLRQRECLLGEVEAALVDAFVDTDRRFLGTNVVSGASVVTCVVTPSELVLGHAGDCRAVMCRDGEAVVLTEDHKASREDERHRIESLGGHVDNFTGIWRVQGIMAVTRGIGDQHLKQYISAVPETSRVNTSSKEDFVILASDGLWDVVTNDEAVAVASAVLFPCPLVGRTDSEKLAVQLQALLSPKVEASNSPVAPLTKKGFKSSSLSAPLSEPQTTRVVNGPRQLLMEQLRNHVDGATSQEKRPQEKSSSSVPGHGDECLNRACKKLVDLAVKRGSYDDISVLVILPSALRM